MIASAMGVVGGGGGNPTHGFQQSASDSTDQSVYTFAAQPLGPAAAGRRVIVAVGWGGPSATTLTSVTIGGVTATVDVDSLATGNRRVVIASAVVPTGGTADVVVTLSAAAGRIGVGVWTLASGAPTGQTAIVTGQSSGTLTVTTVAGQLVVCAAYASAGSGSISSTWTTATERYDLQIENTFDSTSGADVTASGTSTAVGFSTNAGAGVPRLYVAAAYG